MAGQYQYKYRCAHEVNGPNHWTRDGVPINEGDVPPNLLENAACAVQTLKPIPKARDHRGRFTCATIANVTHWYEDGRELRPPQQVPKDQLGIACSNEKGEKIKKASPQKGKKVSPPKPVKKASPPKGKKTSPAKRLLGKLGF